MFASETYFSQIAAVFISLLLIAAGLYSIARMMSSFGLGRNIFVSLAVFSMTVLISVFVIDVVIGFKTELLTPQERTTIVDMIKGFFLLVVGYYFRDSQDKISKNDN